MIIYICQLWDHKYFCPDVLHKIVLDNNKWLEITFINKTPYFYKTYRKLKLTNEKEFYKMKINYTISESNLICT